MHTGFHNKIVYVQMGRVFTFLFPSKILSLDFSWKLSWPSMWSYDGQDLPSIHIEMHLSLKVGPFITPQPVGLKAILSLFHLSSSAKGLGRVAANYNSKSERNQELLWCVEWISTHRNHVIKLRKAIMQSWQTYTVFKRPNKSVF